LPKVFSEAETVDCTNRGGLAALDRAEGFGLIFRMVKSAVELHDLSRRSRDGGNSLDRARLGILRVLDIVDAGALLVGDPKNSTVRILRAAVTATGEAMRGNY